MATLFQILQFFDLNGNPLAGGKIYWYEAGTSTPKTTWTTQQETVAQSHPVILDAEGRIPTAQGSGMWIKGSYKLIIQDSLGSTITSLDYINEYDSLDWTGLTASIADLNSTQTEALIKSSNYTITVSDRNKTILVNAAGGNINITLPNAATVGNKFIVTIKKIDKEVTEVFIIHSGSIDNIPSPYVLYNYNDFITIHSDGSNWKIIAYRRRPLVNVTATTPLSLSLFNNTNVYYVNATSGQKIVNLPDLTVVGKGYIITVKKEDSTSNAVKIIANGSQTIDGLSEISITQQYISYTLIAASSTQWAIIEEVAGIHTISKDWPDKYVTGLNLSQNATNPNIEIDMAAGKARDHTNIVNMTLAATFSKKINANWTAGSGNGGFPSTKTLQEETWYYVFLLSKDDGTQTEMGFDDQINASALIIDSGALGYNKYRRIGSVYTAKTTKYITKFTSSLFNEGSVRLIMWDYYQIPITEADSNIFSYRKDNITLGTNYTTVTITLAVPPVPARIKCLLTTMNEDTGGSQVGDVYVYYHAKNQPKLNNDNEMFRLATNGLKDAARNYNRFELVADGKQIQYETSTASSIAQNITATILGYYENIGEE